MELMLEGRGDGISTSSSSLTTTTCQPRKLGVSASVAGHEKHTDNPSIIFSNL